ncbi:MAG: hypothetical protein ACRDWV_06190, partial [Acidimicrobiales bacterium]
PIPAAPARAPIPAAPARAPIPAAPADSDSAHRSGSPPAPAPFPVAGQPPGWVADLETVCLRLAVHRPADVAGRLTEILFSDPIHRAAFRGLASSATLGDAIAAAEPPVAALLARLAVEVPEEDLDVELPRLVGAAARRALDLLRVEARAAPTRAGVLAPVAGWLKLGIEALNEPMTAVDAAAQLLAWLRGMSPREAVSGER